MRPGGIFETVLYAEDLAAAERFYRDAVGLQVIERGDLAVVFRCGDGVLLIFDSRKTRAAGREVPSTELQVPGTSRSPRSRRTSVHGGSNYTKLESSSNRKWIGKKVAVPSTFAIQPVMLSSCLLQHYGVVVGSLSEDGTLFYDFGDIHCVLSSSV
jgi:hypothetical protein